jgi:hypothetical protein
MRARHWFVATLIGAGCSPVAIVPSQSSPDASAEIVSEGRDAFWQPPRDGGRAVVPDVSANCHREVNLTAVSIGRPVPFDVVIVADNSDSLSWSRDSLSAGVRNLLAQVHGHEVRFFVLTTTQYGASSQGAVSPFDGKELVPWRDTITSAPYAHPVTDYTQACFDAKGATIPCPPPRSASPAPLLKGTWQFRLPPPVAAITPDMTDAQIAAEQQKVSDAILALGGGGAPQEQPVCTLSRFISQDPAALPRHVVFVVLTDEDDTSPSEACLAGIEARHEPFMSDTPSHWNFCNANCDKYSYWVTRPDFLEDDTYTCIPVDDTGQQHPERAVPKKTTFRRSEGCPNPPSGACDAGRLAAAQADCGTGTVVKSCGFTCAEAQGQMTGCDLDRPDDKVNLCTQPFDEAGKHYANLADYCRQKFMSDGWGNCTVYGLKADPISMSFSNTLSKKRLVTAANDAPGMIAWFKGMADNLIGRGNYSVEAIVLDPAFTCPVRPGQSFATNLRQLATSADDVFPLCQDYAPALRRIQTFADVLIQNDFPLDLSVYEDVDSVVVTTRAGTQRTIPKTSYRYDRATHRLHFDPGVLGVQDQRLAVNVARYCEPVIK